MPASNDLDSPVYASNPNSEWLNNKGEKLIFSILGITRNNEWNK